MGVSRHLHKQYAETDREAWFFPVQRARFSLQKTAGKPCDFTIAELATIAELVLSDRSFHSDRSDHIETSL